MHTSRNILIKGPKDINGNRREFWIVAPPWQSGGNDEPLVAQQSPIKGAGVLETIYVSAEEYRRLAQNFDIALNAEDAEIVEREKA